MANIFLDVNKLISIIDGGGEEGLRRYELVVASLSWHIVSYLKKWKIPNKRLEKLFEVLVSVEMSNEIVKKAMIGPTNDFEDNVQLHSAMLGECDYFLTLDRELLKMKHFGKMQICDKI
ncbi:hypothetical protein HYV64_05355 [Candidatus Shapirobacteria bacterium]|nr:hypothetical protein [Candidatus Shapirobacteria bacterium]